MKTLADELERLRCLAMTSSALSPDLSILDYAENGDLLEVFDIIQRYELQEEGTLDIVNIKCPETGMTPLMCASQGRHTEMVRYLMSVDGVDVDAEDKEGDSAIVYACKVGCYEIVDLLITRENIDKRDSYGLTLLMCAVKGNHTEIASLLITRGANVALLSQDDQRYDQWSILTFAAYFEQLSIIKQLYSNGMNVEPLALPFISSELKLSVEEFVQKDMYRTPLHECVYNDDLDKMKQLVLEEKLDINQMYDVVCDDKHSILWKVTPLFLASYLNRLNMVKLLLQLRADKNIECGGMINHHRAGKKFQSVTALMVACSRGYLSIVLTLLQADVYYLVDAAREGDLATVRKLLHTSGKKIVNAYDSDTKMNALLSASFHNHPNVVQFLLRNYKVNTALKTPKGFTSLMLASVKGHTKVVEVLINNVSIKRNLLVNEIDSVYGYNALQWASFKGHKTIMNILVNNGADVISLCRFKRAMDIVSEFFARSSNDMQAQNQTHHHQLLTQEKQDLVTSECTVMGNCRDDTDIDLTCWRHSSSLHKAVYDNDLKQVHEILLTARLRSKVECKCMSNILDAVDDKHGWTALTLACYYNRISILKVLLSYGADISKRIKPNECSAIYVASSRGHFEVVDILLSAICECEESMNFVKMRILQQAARAQY